MATTSCAKRKELEKFKRRLIREVARRMLQEKQPEDDVWKGLNTETGYDCKLLWTRMKSITLKKLRLMLAAEDRVDAIAKAARMSVTDWLFFDLVLVHENIDVIGMDGPRAKQGELKPLTDLFSLVQKFNLQSLADKNYLADAWTEATLYYNGQGHHVSPMLLQKRWYQLKQSTRLCFYSFWYSYRGNAKYYDDAAAQHSPTMLQMAVARRFVEVITKPLPEWEEMIQKGLIIPSEEFDNRLRPVAKQSDEDVPDIVVVEPVVETIELDSDTETDTEKEKSNAIVTPVTKTVIKTEPEEIDIDIEENLTADNMNLLENSLVEDFNELSDIDTEENNLLQNISSIDGDSVSRASEIHDENIITQVPDDDIVSAVPNVSHVSNEINDVISAFPDEDNMTFADKNMEDVKAIQIDTKEEIQILPQIANVFGNVDISSESQTELNVLPATTISVHDDDDDDNVDLITINDNEIDIKHNISVGQDVPGLHKEPIHKPEEVVDIKDLINKSCEKAFQKLVGETKAVDTIKEVALKSEETVSSFGELPNYLNLVDNGIELADDGIAYVDEEVHLKNENVEIKSESAYSEDDEESTPAEDSPKIDLKLLLYPVVYTTKLDHMSIANACSDTVVGKPLLDVFLAESKPISKNTVNLDIVKKESEYIENNISDSEESYDEIISNDLRVKISSNLLQKPRTRNYNPIILCKNPDFNTRLKRLTVGFLSSARNRMFLKYCKPLTIDVSKAFESKLVNGTIYLKTMDENIPREKEVSSTECSQQSSVIPSAMPAQSLFDNQKVPAFVNSTVAPTQTNDDHLISERSKVINLPDISQVRRLNQRLLTAEVTPIQVNNNDANTPLPIVKPSYGPHSQSVTDCNKVNNIQSFSQVKPNNRHDSQINENTNSNVNVRQSQANIPQRRVKESSNSKMSRLNTLLGNLNTVRQYNKKSSQNTPANDKKKILLPWKPRETRPAVTWLKKKGGYPIPNDDALITLDTLNKMLLVLSKEKDERELIMQKTSKQINKKCKDLENKTKEQRNNTGHQQIPTQLSVDGSVSDDVQIVSDTRSNDNHSDDKQNHKPKINIVEKKRHRPMLCCWARERILVLTNKRKRTRRHDCPMPLCKCCCVVELLKLNQLTKDKTQRIEQACQTIENVVQQTYSGIPIFQVTSPNTTVTNLNQADANLKQIDGTNSIINEKKTITDNSNIKTSTSVGTQSESSAVVLPSLHSHVSVMSSENPAEATVNNCDTKISSQNSAEATVNLNSDEIQATITQEAQSTQIKVTVRPDGVNPVVVSPQFNTQSGTDKDVSVLNLLKTSWKKQSESLCKCQINVAVESPQRRLVIDASKKCPIHKSIVPKVTPNEKQIFLTSSQISQQPSKNPIYLGKNKILLTNIKFPPGFAAGAGPTELPPMVKIVPTLPLPTGVKLILLPNGELTYTIEPNTQLDTEQLKYLPEILEAVKKQLNDTLAPPLKNISTGNEVINLSDDESDKSIENPIKPNPQMSDSNNDKEPINTDDCNQNPTNNEGIPSSQAVAVESTKEAIQDDQNSSTSGMECTLGSRIEVVKDVTPYQSVPIQNKLSDNENQTLTTGKDIESNSKDENQTISEKDYSEKIKTVSETDVLANQANEENNTDKDGKSKNILSDLMEMSGIFTDDVVPVPKDTPEVSQVSEPPALLPFHLPDVSTASLQPESYDLSLGKLSEFSAITSFAELKYASMHNGLFYKCDFDTGTIVPINVCIKKQTPRQPKDASLPTSTIDLTDDDVAVNNEPSTSFSRSVLRHHYSPKSREIGKAKPLKLFKSVHPKILRSFSTFKVNKSGVYTFKNIDRDRNINKTERRFRKQMLKKIEATIDMVDSDCPMEEEYLDSSDSDNEARKRSRPTPSSDDSSDEEPLSNLAKRMKVNNKDDKNKDSLNSEKGNTEQLTTEQLTPDKQDATESPNDDGDAILEQESFSFMLDQSDGEEGEDCILGV